MAARCGKISLLAPSTHSSDDARECAAVLQPVVSSPCTFGGFDAGDSMRCILLRGDDPSAIHAWRANFSGSVLEFCRGTNAKLTVFKTWRAPPGSSVKLYVARTPHPWMVVLLDTRSKSAVDRGWSSLFAHCSLRLCPLFTRIAGERWGDCTSIRCISKGQHSLLRTYQCRAEWTSTPSSPPASSPCGRIAGGPLP